ncbi:oxidoreductase molybdopterin binding domain protein [Aeromicrobium marinum DSM 15272]|uniref:Oxidoreductase molybdopterin binding domain protein n=1 Tax=Aeromicrobium marinum DSM 15272 TaxID=585531 RepID=E2SF57_9ACTN|nr:molybdopterin-dependent oxidoreductase [Aeromicrobium marinum]EFQ82142.1 oxidoreductase molybdopterin binding domain protein [Aeromicrobium marinum DSM 15272]
MRLPTVADVERLLPAPDDFTSRARGPRTTARVGTALGITFGICFLTGVWSHLQYDPPAWAPIGPDPVYLYRITQGLHIITGVASIPLLLVKLWSAFPRLFIRPPLRPAGSALVHLLERASIAVLVAASIFMVASGLLNIAQWYPWDFSFRRTHEAMAWVLIGALLVHLAVKLPTIRAAYSAEGEPGDPEDDPADPDDRDEDGPSRRTVVRAAGISAVVAGVLVAGQAVPGLRRVSLFAPRTSDGPQGLSVNRTARAAGVLETAPSPDFVLELVRGSRSVSLTRAELEALPQRTHVLPMACVEGWSRDAEWTGVAVRDLVAMVGGDPDAAVAVTSLQTRGAFGTSELPGQFVADHRTLLALRINGEELSHDHGFPCRIIAPNRPGVLQTKWVQRLEVRT